MSLNAAEIEIVREYKLCAVCPTYFIYKYYRILGNGGRPVPFIQHDIQKQIVNVTKEEKTGVLVDADRRSGITETCIAFCVWTALFSTDESAVVMLVKGIQCRDIMREKIEIALSNLPDFLKREITVNNKNEIRFKDGASILLGSPVGHGVRGVRTSLIFCDNAGMLTFKEFSQFMLVTSPLISLTAKLLLANTGWMDSDINEIWYKKTPNFKKLLVMKGASGDLMLDTKV